MIDIEVCTVSNKPLGKVRVPPSGSVKDIKTEISKLNKKLYVDRQSIRTDGKGKDVKDSTKIVSLNLQNGSKVYVKDLGPQISWRIVFLCEYFGPLFVYLLFTIRPWLFYGTLDESQDFSFTAKLAAVCYVGHYVKRILETIFVHRFSHATMPIRNLFKNCSYYWGFTAFVAYHVNHPLYTPPACLQALIGLAFFLFGEAGNLSIHLLLRDLRPPGTKVRKIPMPNTNPLTNICDYVSCPHYTYEFAAWLGFSIMTSCFPAFLFSLAGLYQMTVWALGKHRNYHKEFPNYPKERKAILPFAL